MRLPARLALLSTALIVSAPLCAQPTAAPLTLKPADASDPVEVLSRNLRILSDNPRSIDALVGAGEAAVQVGDANAALGFFGRAEEIAPRNGRVKAGLGAALVQLEKPKEALKLFDQATDLGMPEVDVAADRGLAHDLRGETRRAIADYQLALRRRDEPETRRRLALAQAISGDRAGALATLDPLLRGQDKAAWRARTFVLALTGDAAGATEGAAQLLPHPQALAMAPFLGKLGGLRAEQKAAAVHFGHIPTPGVRSGERLADAGPAARAAAGGPAAENGTAEDRDPRRRPGRAPLALAMAGPRPTLDAPVAQTKADEARAAPSPQPAEPLALTASGPVIQARTDVSPPGAVPAPDLPQLAGPAKQDAVPPPSPVALEPVRLAANKPTPPVPPPTSLSPPASTSAPPIVRLQGPGIDGAPLKPVPVTLASVEAPKSVPSTAKAIPSAPAAGATAKPAEADKTAPLKLAAAASRVAKPSAAASPEPKPGAGAKPPPLKLASTATKKSATGDNAKPDAAVEKADSKTGKSKLDGKLQLADKGSDRTDKKAAEKDDKKPAKKDGKAASARKEPQRHWVQVAGGANKATLPKAWTALKQKWPKELAGRSPWTTPLRFTNRLLIGPFGSAAEAQAFVNRTGQSGFSTFTFTSDVGQAVEKLGS